MGHTYRLSKGRMNKKKQTKNPKKQTIKRKKRKQQKTDKVAGRLHWLEHWYSLWWRYCDQKKACFSAGLVGTFETGCLLQIERVRERQRERESGR